MGEDNPRGGGGSGGSNSSSSSSVVEIYPLSRYYFGSKGAVPGKDDAPADRVQRLKSNSEAHGLRTCVEGVILEAGCALVKQTLMVCRENFRASSLIVRMKKMMIGRVPQEFLLEHVEEFLWISSFHRFIIGECLGIWWRSDFETLPLPYLPSHVQKPKECTKLFLVRLPVSRQFVVPKNLKLLAVPLCQIHDNSETYGPIISGIPQLLSKFSFDMDRT